MTAPSGIRRLRTIGALAVISAALGGCWTSPEVVTATVPNDYRQRHPIAVQEANHSTVVFAGFGQSWMREGTGGVIIDVPVNTPNARAAASAAREIRHVLSASGVPAGAMRVNHYSPDD